MRAGPAAAAGLLTRAGPAAAGLLAALLALPGARLPFLSDDWAHLLAVRDTIPCCMPYGDFRPLALASLWLDVRLFGLQAGWSHVVQAVLIGLAAALVAVVTRRLAGDDRVALGAGALFAFHPYHVENAAWIAARGDVLMTIFFLLGVLAYDRWRAGARTPGVGVRGVPWAALAALQAALLSKEAAVAFPVALLVAAWVLPGRIPDGREWRRGLAPILALTAIHFAIVRPWFLGGMGRTALGQTPAGAVKAALVQGIAAWLPLDPERLREQPWMFASLAAGLAAAFVFLARRGSGRFPWPAAAAAVLFAALLLPDVVGVQRRYLFLPSAAAAAALALVMRDAGRRLAGVMLLAIACVWIPATLDAWRSWRLAARASETLLEDLQALASREEVRDIVATALPLRVGGASVGGDFRAALTLRSGREAPPIRALTWINVAAPEDTVIEPVDSFREPAGSFPASPPEVLIFLPPRRHARFLGPHPPADGKILRSPWGDVEDVGEHRWRVRPEPGPGRLLVAWNEGRVLALGPVPAPAGTQPAGSEDVQRAVPEGFQPAGSDEPRATFRSGSSQPPPAE